MYKWSNEWKRKGFYAILILFCGCCFIGISKKTKETEGEIQQKESVEESGVKEKPSIAITFDDGPSSRYTGRLLDGLKERNVKASFFLIGENAEENPVLVERIYKEGHLIGNHTYRHVDLSKISGREAEKEIKTTDEAIKKITGHETEFIRPPFGAMPEGEEDPDKIYVKWTVDSLDWVTKDTEKIVEKVTADTKEGDVILMHDCYGESVEAALQIVDIMEKQGYEFVTADELIIN